RQATQLAATYLSENRFEARISNLVVLPRWRVLEVGDWINFNSARWGNKTYLVVSRTIQPLEKNGPRNVLLELQERDGTIYNEVGVITPPVVPPPNDAPAYLEEVQGLSVTAVVLAGDNGLASPGIRVSWSQIEDPTVGGVQIEYRAKAVPGNVFVKQIYNGVTVTFLSEGIVQQTEYEVRTVLLTTGRVVTATAWQTVTTSAIASGDVTVTLSNTQDDIKDLFKQFRLDIDEIRELLEWVSGSAGAATVEQSLRSTDLEVSTAEAKAAVIAESIARVSGDDALAATITALEASLGDSLASGLMKMEANVDPQGAWATITFYARITTADDFKETGLILEVYTDGPDIKSRTVLKSDSFIVTDGSNINAPFVYENGELALALARIVVINAGLIQSNDGLMQIDLDAGLISIDDGVV
ncbi:MAG: hypothetical protein GY788_24710, partial [bacterium]|nr:hypothetical protein [bacterium]